MAQFGVTWPEKCSYFAGREGYQEPFAGARDRVLLVLRIIVPAHLASRLTQQANLLIGRMED